MKNVLRSGGTVRLNEIQSARVQERIDSVRNPVSVHEQFRHKMRGYVG